MAHLSTSPGSLTALNTAGSKAMGEASQLLEGPYGCGPDRDQSSAGGYRQVEAISSRGAMGDLP